MKRLAIFLGFLVVSLVAALAPAGDQTEAQANCFPETGFCITNSAFATGTRSRGRSPWRASRSRSSNGSSSSFKGARSSD